MTVRNAEAVWQGTLREGTGQMAVGSGAFEGAFSFGTRFEEEPGTNPEELIGAAHAACFSMALAGRLTTAGFPPERIETKAIVHLGRDDIGALITQIALSTTAHVPGVDEATFQELAAKTKELCPVSRALAGVPIALTAKLVAS
jgi:osmotically inducible protein OsmC